MAEEESVLASPPTAQDARHVRDYSRFTGLMKWSALVGFVIAMFIVIFVL